MACDFLKLAVAGVQSLQPYQPGKPIEELERELGISNSIKLASNENPLGPSPKALAAIEQSLKELARYPDSNGHLLKQALYQRFALKPEQITLGNGSNDLLEMIARCFLQPGTEAVFSEYSFIVYPLVTQACGAQGVIAPAREFGHNLQAMAEAVTDKTRLVFIANPNNPTGTYVSSRELCAFLDHLPQQVLVVLDEAYTEYVTREDFPNGLDLLARYPNLIVTRTFSKAYGLAALRVGYAVAHPEITDLLNRVRQPFNVNTPALAAAAAMLEDSEYLEKSLALNTRGLDQLTQGLRALGLGYIPSVANFITLDLARDALPVYQALLKEGVIVRPLGVYAMPHHLRISVGTDAENTRFLRALKKVLAC